MKLVKDNGQEEVATRAAEDIIHAFEQKPDLVGRFWLKWNEKSFPDAWAEMRDSPIGKSLEIIRLYHFDLRKGKEGVESAANYTWSLTLRNLNLFSQQIPGSEWELVPQEEALAELNKILKKLRKEKNKQKNKR